MKHVVGIVLILVTLGSLSILSYLGETFEDASQIEHGRFLIYAIILLPPWSIFFHSLFKDE